MGVQVARESMRAQRLGWDEGTSGGREYEGPEVGWDEGTSGGREYEGPEVGVGRRYKWREYEGPEVGVG